MRVLNVLAALGLLLSYLATFVSPSEIWWLVLFALGYPLLLIVNIAFIVYWLFRRKTWMYLSLGVVLIGLPFVTQFFQLFPKNQIPEQANSLKVLNYNVRLFDLHDWEEGSDTRDQILKLIQRRDADVMCFQEFYHNGSKRSFPTRNRLLEMYPDIHYHEFYTHELAGKQHFGGVTFSKYPIINKGNVPFTSDNNNYCMFTDIVAHGDTLRVYNLHLMSIRFEREDYTLVEEGASTFKQVVKGGWRIGKRLTETSVKRSMQSQKVLESVSQSPYPVILCGDFNDTPVSYVYEQFDDHLTDSFTEAGSGIGNTYIGVFPSFRIDYVWHSSTLNSANYRTLPEKFSDHHPIEVSVYWE